MPLHKLIENSTPRTGYESNSSTGTHTWKGKYVALTKSIARKAGKNGTFGAQSERRQGLRRFVNWHLVLI